MSPLSHNNPFKTKLSVYFVTLGVAVATALPVLAAQAMPATPPVATVAPAALSVGPTLMSPADGALMGQISASLKWARTDGSSWYHIQMVPFNNDGPGIDLVVGDTVKVAASSFDIAAPDFGGADPNYILLPDMTYTWRVRTSSNVGVPVEADWTAWSSRTFKTPTRSGTTIGATTPPEGMTITGRTPVMTWFNTDRTVFYYEIQISKSATFGSTAFLFDELIHGGISHPIDSYTVSSQYQLEPATLYYWRVRPRVQGDGVPAGWSGVFTFRTS